jgi:hypothetical protein
MKSGERVLKKMRKMRGTIFAATHILGSNVCTAKCESQTFKILPFGMTTLRTFGIHGKCQIWILCA